MIDHLLFYSASPQNDDEFVGATDYKDENFRQTRDSSCDPQKVIHSIICFNGAFWRVIGKNNSSSDNFWIKWVVITANKELLQSKVDQFDQGHKWLLL